MARQSQGGGPVAQSSIMPYGMYLSAEGAQMQAHRLEVLSNNLANVNTPGFKPDIPIFQARLAEALQQGLEDAGTGGLDDIGGGVLNVEISTDFSQGPIQKTGIKTDLAILGEGFFEIAGEGNQRLLTKAGNFVLTSQGELVTTSGRNVLDESGVPIVLAANPPWSVTSDGFIVQGDAAVALSIVMPESLNNLTKMGENLFQTQGAVTPVEAPNVRQGYLEQSGVNPTLEMMSLIETSRAYEANTRLIQHQDSMIDSLISRVLQG